MQDDNFDDVSPEEFQPESDDLKKKVAADSAKSAALTPEDTSRSTLHYGEDHEGEVVETNAPDAAPSATAPEQDEAPSQEEEQALPREEATSLETGAAQEELPQADVPDETHTPTGPRAKSADTEGAPRPAQSEPLAGGVEAGTATPRQAGKANALGDADAGKTGAPEPVEKTEEVNRAPSQVKLSNQELAENAEGAIVGKLSVKDQDTGDTHTYSVSDDRFEVVDGHVKLKDGISLNHEEAAQITLDVTATDASGGSRTESFEITVTDVNEAPIELSLSNLAIAENTDGAVIGHLSVTDPDAGDVHSFEVSDARFEVVDGQVKLKDGIRLDHEEASELTLEVTATDGAGHAITQNFDVQVADMPDVDLGTGFHARYFDMDERLEELDDVNWDAPPTHEELVGDIDYANGRGSFWEGGSTDTFGVQITGNIEVEEGGTFNFHIGGDDGVVLYINGQEVVDNDGLHGFRTRSGEVELDAGTHVVEVRYFENYGHAGLKVEWEGPGLDGRELLSPPAVEDLQTVNGMPVSVHIEADMSSAPDGSFTQVIEGLPPGTQVQTGDTVTDVGDDGVADITGLDTSILHITPPVDFTGTVDAQVTTTVILDSGDAAISMTDLNITVDQADVAPPDIDLQAGFRASYFDVDHGLSKLDQIDWSSDPTHEEVVGEIDYANGRGSFWEGGSTDTFGARISGDVTIEEGGTFNFFVGGDDGVVLYVNGVEVIDNDGLHGYRTRSGEIELEPGTHEIEVRYFENYGHAGLKLEWEGPGTDGRELVQADNELAVPENGTLDVQLAHTDYGSDATVTISGLPEDTILVSGSDSIVSDGSEVDLSGWDLDLIELMPPPGYEGLISAEITVVDTAFNGETVQNTETFEIEVGDIENAAPEDRSDESMLMAEGEDPEGGGAGWADDAATQGDGSESSDDDVMQEPVSENHGSDESFETTETYERNDW